MPAMATIIVKAARLSASPGALVVGAPALFAQAMGPRLLAQAAFGPICSGHASTAWHCPSCYLAASLAAAALASLLPADLIAEIGAHRRLRHRG